MAKAMHFFSLAVMELNYSPAPLSQISGKLSSYISFEDHDPEACLSGADPILLLLLDNGRVDLACMGDGFKNIYDSTIGTIFSPAFT